MTLLIGTLLGACGGEQTTTPHQPAPSLIPQTYAVSDCGGFLAAKAAPIATPVPAAGYCDAEVLRWTYDKTSGKLAFSNDRVNLNCCGERKVQLSENNGTYVIHETDAPESIITAQGPSEARCGCMCVFDLAVEAESIPGGMITVQLVRDVTDSNQPARTLFTGSIDLSAGSGSGSVVIDSSPVGLDASERCPMMP